MWPFKPRKRFVIMKISDGTYYSGETGLGREFGTVGWALDEENAQLFNRASADRVQTAMIISRIGGNHTFGPTAVIEL